MTKFYRTSTWVLMLLISCFGSFFGDITWKVNGFNIILGIKIMLILSMIIFIANLPEIISMVLTNKKERGRINNDK